MNMPMYKIAYENGFTWYSRFRNDYEAEINARADAHGRSFKIIYIGL